MEKERICPYCNEKFRTEIWNKRFCCHDHRKRFDLLIQRKELFRLSEYEKDILERLKNEEN